MTDKRDGIGFPDKGSFRRPAYSAPRLQRLGRVSELTEINSNQAFDGGGYAS